MNDLSWLLDRRLSGPQLIHRAFERAQDDEAKREVRHAAIEVAWFLDEQLAQHWRGKELQHSHDPIALALTRARLEVLTAGDAGEWPVDVFEPREGDRPTFEKALADAYAAAGEVFSRRLAR